jgi:general L-amino acid transport system substrate-binding protein
MIWTRMLLAGFAAVPFAAQAQGTGSPTLDAVRARGQLVCGIAGNIPGFSLPDSQGAMRGLDADGCRAVAAVALGDASKVRFSPLTTTNRFTALQSGEVDILIRDTTWTLGREAGLGLLFAGVNYYDGTGFMVKKSAGVASAKELDGATICVQPGTSTELAIADYFRINKISFKPVEIQDLQEIHNAFTSGRCDAYSTDGSQLAGYRFSLGAQAADYVILPEVISKEPLGPVVRKGDDKWFDLVRWTGFAQLAAEELGVSSKTVDADLKSTNPDVRRLLGVEGDLGTQLAVQKDFAATLIRQVGNFGEMWDRDIAPLGVARGLNNLWTKGGLQYAPPLR